MKVRFYLFILSVLFYSVTGCSGEATDPDAMTDIPEGPQYVLVLHGGAGSSAPDDIPSALREAYHASMQQALKAGEAVLKGGGPAMEAVIAAIEVMENDSLFNAGRGAVLTEDGDAELDASLMEGNRLDAGAVAGVKHIKNPVLAAKAVMLNSRHVMLSGAGADNFAVEQGLDTVSQAYFITPGRLKQHKKASRGTVGAVALDKEGNLAAGTSTGGMSQKKWGRIGDSPIIGAGTYADNRSCAVSATGHGEFFIRNAVAHDIHARMLYGKETLEAAAHTVIHEVLRKKFDANGGIIGLDYQGNISMIFNTSAMFRGYIKAGEPPETFIFSGTQ
ncbi:MAG: isoaspartyl peptidase/L-asparaginase [Bacteroidales bacterium]